MFLIGISIGLLFGFIGGVIALAVLLFIFKKNEVKINKIIERTNEKGEIFESESELANILNNQKEEIKIG